MGTTTLFIGPAGSGKSTVAGQYAASGRPSSPARVTAVDSAQAAMSQVELEVPALIVADIGMPGEDGLSMMRRIRGRQATAAAEVPAIALSAYARAEDRQAALDAGFDDFLTKPAMPAEILRAIDRALTDSAARLPRG